MSDTTAPGAYDIIVFENKGWECIGKKASIPPTDEDMYRPKVAEYVESLTLPQDAGTYRMTYEVHDGVCQATWSPLSSE